jgi:hypothetical protein
MKAYLHLIKYALKNDCTISVFDGEAWDVKRSTKYTEIKESAECSDETQLRIRNQAGEVVGWALISDAIDFEPEETVIDHTITPFMDAWSSDYLAHQDEVKQ